MRWLMHPVIFLFIMTLQIYWMDSTELKLMSQREIFHSSVNGTCMGGNCSLGIVKEKLGRKFTTCSRSGKCEAGHKIRRKHCLKHRVCGDRVKVQVKRCHGQRHQNFNKFKEKAIIRNKNSMQLHKVQRRLLHANEMQKRIRGFSPWSKWTLCSRKCTTVRRRYCMVPAICGRRILRQSAYCYLDGSFCQHWIRERMQARKDPGMVIRDRSQSLPIKINHPRESPLPLPEPECGQLGHYRGSPANRMRARMQNMLRIIGGRPAAPGKWPWQVVVLNRFKEAFCGGTLISLRWVVTAAHCVRRRMYVRLGEHDLFLPSPRVVEMRVLKAVVHPKYDPDTVINDVALLSLPWPARPDLGHGVVCLPKQDQRLRPHTTCVILGWGKRHPTDTHGTRLLHEAQVSTIEQEVCRQSYWQYLITDDMVCAGRGRRDSCAGDSGGPLLCRDKDMRYYLQGITSFGDGCGKRDKFGIYTRTTGYVDWMKKVMQS